MGVVRIDDSETEGGNSFGLFQMASKSVFADFCRSAHLRKRHAHGNLFIDFRVLLCLVGLSIGRSCKGSLYNCINDKLCFHSIRTFNDSLTVASGLRFASSEIIGVNHLNLRMK